MEYGREFNFDMVEKWKELFKKQNDFSIGINLVDELLSFLWFFDAIIHNFLKFLDPSTSDPLNH